MDFAGIPVVVTYKVKEGQETSFRDLLGRHVRALTRRGLIAPGSQIVHLKDKAQERTYLEVFTWKDQAAIDAAHSDPEVGPVWEAMENLTETDGITPVHYEAV